MVKVTSSSVRSEGSVAGRARGMSTGNRVYRIDERNGGKVIRAQGEKRTGRTGIRCAPPELRERSCYLQTGSPSPAVDTSALVVLTPMEHMKGAGICVWATVAYHAPAYVVMVGSVTPVEGLKCRNVSPRAAIGAYVL